MLKKRGNSKRKLDYEFEFLYFKNIIRPFNCRAIKSGGGGG